MDKREFENPTLYAMQPALIEGEFLFSCNSQKMGTKSTVFGNNVDWNALSYF